MYNTFREAKITQFSRIKRLIGRYDPQIGGYMTKQRALILNIIRAGKFHYTADDIFVRAREELPGISRATVYNNLHAMEDERLIRRITGDGGPDRYDSSYVPHGHLICTVCHGVTDFNVPHFDDTLSEVIGEQVESYELKVRRVCPACRAAQTV